VSARAWTGVGWGEAVVVEAVVCVGGRTNLGRPRYGQQRLWGAPWTSHWHAERGWCRGECPAGQSRPHHQSWTGLYLAQPARGVFGEGRGGFEPEHPCPRLPTRPLAPLPPPPRARQWHCEDKKVSGSSRSRPRSPTHARTLTPPRFTFTARCAPNASDHRERPRDRAQTSQQLQLGNWEPGADTPRTTVHVVGQVVY
jgi:hypothetical protein